MTTPKTPTVEEQIAWLESARISGSEATVEAHANAILSTLRNYAAMERWIKEHAQHDERLGGQCYGLVRGRYVGDPPDMVYEEHTCKCGLDALRAAIDAAREGEK